MVGYFVKKKLLSVFGSFSPDGSRVYANSAEIWHESVHHARRPKGGVTGGVAVCADGVGVSAYGPLPSLSLYFPTSILQLYLLVVLLFLLFSFHTRLIYYFLLFHPFPFY